MAFRSETNDGRIPRYIRSDRLPNIMKAREAITTVSLLSMKLAERMMGKRYRKYRGLIFPPLMYTRRVIVRISMIRKLYRADRVEKWERIRL